MTFLLNGIMPLSQTGSEPLLEDINDLYDFLIVTGRTIDPRKWVEDEVARSVTESFGGLL